MRLSACQFVFFLTIIFACGYANAGSIAKRASSSSLVTDVENALGGIPLIGSSLSGLVKWFVSIFNLIEESTNGAIGRFLGGALPCTVSLDGTVCTGLQTNGGIGKLLMDVLDGIPSLILPGFVKSGLNLLIESFADPIADVIFGGVAVNN